MVRSMLLDTFQGSRRGAPVVIDRPAASQQRIRVRDIVSLAAARTDSCSHGSEKDYFLGLIPQPSDAAICEKA